MSHPTLAFPELTTLLRVDIRGLEDVGLLIAPNLATIECRAVEPDPLCGKCDTEGVIHRGELINRSRVSLQ